jgi:5-methylcytosine-specific restriction endonuclease McrA
VSQVSNLIREIDRQVKNEGHLYGSVWARMREKYIEKPKAIPAVRKKPRVHKTVVRLKGAKMAQLREDRYELDGHRCVKCGCKLSLYPSGLLPVMELSHKKSRGSGGGDTIENTESNCGRCHRASHNAGGKPCPAKPVKG